jgi:phage shock protein PspC (stress-responsive transcriptional regulator)
MSTEKKRLYRSQNDRMIGGVCGGLGEYLGIDSTVIRLIFVLATIWGGSGALVYLIMLLVVPDEPLAAGAPTSVESPVVIEDPQPAVETDSEEE